MLKKLKENDTAWKWLELQKMWYAELEEFKIGYFPAGS